METERTLALIDEFGEMGVFDLTLAGGEPLLHPDALGIIERSVKAGIRVGVLSNGVVIDEKMQAELERITTSRDFILQISIDSVDPAVNDMSRGRTEKVVENIHRLTGSSLEVQLACVVHKLNVESAHLLIDEFYPHVKRFHFLNIQRTEEAYKYPELLLDEEEAFDFWLRLNEHAKQFPEDLFLPSLRIQMRSFGNANVDPEFALHGEASFDCKTCSAGWTHINVDSRFNVLGCDIAKDFTVMGNLRERSFASVWNSEEAAKVRNSPYPACYKIRDRNGEALEDWLKPEFREKAGAGAS
jgi:MoaA/NifB/PqqE/SkfB family radical SAM enzyme